MALPHINNSQAGVNNYDPVHSSLFEVYFSLPEAIREQFGQDEALITEHVLKITGLDNLTKGPGKGEQKFMGTTRSFVQPKLDNTSAEISITFSLNLRNGVDNYIFKIFRAWKDLNYNLNTGATTLKSTYVAPYLNIKIGNRAGDVIRDITFKNVMLFDSVTGLDELDYTNNDAKELEVKFVSDSWLEKER